MTKDIEGIPEIALRWTTQGKGAALATVVQTWGSAPRRVGAQLVVSGGGEIEGSVSGGCVEGAVVIEAMDAIEDGKCRLLEFGISDGDAFASGLACGGTIRIFVEPIGATLPVKILKNLVNFRKERIPVAYVVDVETGEGRLERAGFDDRFRADLSGFEGAHTFVAIHTPPLRLAIVGAVHIAQALVPMARLVGYDPVLIDPRAAFGSQARFPGERIIEDWPDVALVDFGIDARTAVVLLSHDPKIDDPAIKIALQSQAFYIGALGSKRTQKSRIERLSKAGIKASHIARIHGPVGLDIAASGPAEIALSILAEMTAVLRQKP